MQDYKDYNENYFSDLIKKAKAALVKAASTLDKELNQNIWDVYAGLCGYRQAYVEYFKNTQELKEKMEKLEEELAFYRKQEIFDSEKHKKAFDDGVEKGKSVTLEALAEYIKTYAPIKPGMTVLIKDCPEYTGCFGEIVMYNTQDDSVFVKLKHTGKQLLLLKNQYSILDMKI